MRYLIVGASGQIGGHLRARLEAAGHTVAGTYATVPVDGLVSLDLAHTDALRAAVADLQPEVVILAAGWTWVDGNEGDPGKAHALNCTQPAALCRMAEERGARFVVFSTDYVFDGTAERPYREDDPTAPLNVYGEAKRAMEEAVLAIGARHLILRTSTVYGPERQGKNFVYQLVRRLRGGLPFRVPNDQVATPSYAPDVADATLALLDQGAEGIWHVVGPDALARHELAAKACAVFDLDMSAVQVDPTSALKQAATRPLMAALDSSKLAAAGVRVRGVDDGLRAMKAAIEAGGWAGLEAMTA